MAIIDLDSHLRDGWLLDEIYRLPEIEMAPARPVAPYPSVLNWRHL